LITLSWQIEASDFFKIILTNVGLKQCVKDQRYKYGLFILEVKMGKVKQIEKKFFLIFIFLIGAVFHLEADAWETGTDLPGMDYKNFWINKDTEAFVAVKQCEDACQKDPQCKAFTYVNPGLQGTHGRCYLKKAVPSPVKNTCCISGVVRPETKSAYCKNYALKAVEFGKNNINWNCGYTGNRWTEDYTLHYNWCMQVQESNSKYEAAERIKLMDQCLKPIGSGDLSANGWCYEIDKHASKISFYPVVKNEGQTDWKSKKEGYYTIGVGGPSSVRVEKKYKLHAFPHWYLEKKEVAMLEGLTLPYHPENRYGTEKIWAMWHPEDTNNANNSNPGLRGFFKGESFETDPKLVVNMCKFYEADEFIKPVFGLQPVMGRRNLVVILWDPHRAAHLAAPKSLIEKTIFGSRPSVNDYFIENSGGSFKLNRVGVFGWYDADKPADHYWNHPDRPCKDGFISGHIEKWVEAIKKADKEFNFKKFDFNNDNTLSPEELVVLIVIPQNNPFGTRREVIGKEYPERKNLVVDGVKIRVLVEAYIGSPPSIGLVAHELSHIMFEADDMYFDFFQPYSAGPYSLMDDSPPLPGHIDPFHKLKLGWIQPKIIRKTGWYEVPDIEKSHKAYILFDPKRGYKEYFLLENRWRGTSYDMNLPSSGLAIWHIIEDKKITDKLPAPRGVDPTLWNDSKWSSWTRRGIRMIRPIYGPPSNWSLWDGSNPQTGYNLLSVDPNPNHANLKWVDNTPSGFSIMSIPPSSSIMKVKIICKN
jgi:M6 family metalloprotease-like protein